MQMEMKDLGRGGKVIFLTRARRRNSGLELSGRDQTGHLGPMAENQSGLELGLISP